MRRVSYWPCTSIVMRVMRVVRACRGHALLLVIGHISGARRLVGHLRESAHRGAERLGGGREGVAAHSAGSSAGPGRCHAPRIGSLRQATLSRV